MGEYVEAGGLRTWYDERGVGDPLVLMHGGVVDSRFFDKNIDAVAEHFRVFAPERRGHGHTPDVEGPITYDLMAKDMIASMEAVVPGPAHLVGHSDGAFVCLLIAIRRPDLVRKLVLISGGFHRDGFVQGGGEFDVDEVVQFMGGPYAQVSPDGADHFRVVVEKIAELSKREPDLDESELAKVNARTLVMFGDDDLMTIAHANATYEGIANSELAIVPGTSHFQIQEKPDLWEERAHSGSLSTSHPSRARARRARRVRRHMAERGRDGGNVRCAGGENPYQRRLRMDPRPFSVLIPRTGAAAILASGVWRSSATTPRAASTHPTRSTARAT